MPGFDEEGSPFSRFDAGGGSAGGGFGGGGGGKGGLLRFGDGATTLPSSRASAAGMQQQVDVTSQAAAMRAHMMALENAMRRMMAQSPGAYYKSASFRSVRDQWARVAEYFGGLGEYLKRFPGMTQ